MPAILFNGTSFASREEMPPAVRQAFDQAMGALADRNQNGVPDIFEGQTGSGEKGLWPTVKATSSMKIVMDGKSYSSAEDFPPDARERYRQAKAKAGRALADSDGDGVPDLLERTAGGAAPPAFPASTTIAPSAPALSPAIEETPSAVRAVWIFLAGVLAAALCFAAAVLAWFLLQAR